MNIEQPSVDSLYTPGTEASIDAVVSELSCHSHYLHSRELKLAIEELDPQFDSSLFTRMFNPDEYVRPMKVRTQIGLFFF